MPGTIKPVQQDWQVLYRDGTLRHAALAGIMRPSFLCRKCGKSQVVSGRKQVLQGTSRFGYHCARCVDANYGCNAPA